MSLFCSHRWELEKEEMVKPLIQEYREMFSDNKYPAAWFERKHLLILKCTKCGQRDVRVTCIDP